MALARGIDPLDRRIQKCADERVNINSVIFIQFKDLISSTGWTFPWLLKSFQAGFRSYLSTKKSNTQRQTLRFNHNHEMIIFNQRLCGRSPFFDSLFSVSAMINDQ
jgi:hypothetical protein